MNLKSYVTKNLTLLERDIYQFFDNNFLAKKGFLITYFNQNSFNLFYSNYAYQNALKNSLVYQEGIGMYIAYKFWGIKNVDRIDSGEIINWMINLIIKKKEKVIFIGGKFDETDIKKRCEMKKLLLEFYHHGFLDDYQTNELIQKINNIKARFVLIGMGSPQQEILAHKLFQKSPEKVFICIGNFMNYFLGYQKRAPKILRTIQLEWLYRLFQEPKRLFKRYIVGIPLFLYRVFFHFK
ncbi:MAG: WecB/TagA/CpsF family glycosyltransferase [Candidatus Woesearchaeota archaeon]